jgi:hypothetical protein
MNDHPRSGILWHWKTLERDHRNLFTNSVLEVALRLQSNLRYDWTGQQDRNAAHVSAHF